ncbi:MAG: SCO family protein [Acidiferrobacterales bacterium]
MSKLKIALIGLVFILPVALSYTLYSLGWRPSGTVNRGELIDPSRSIRDVSLQTLDGGKIRFHDLRRRWSLIYFGPAECLSPCELNLYKMRQVRLAQGKNADRIRRLFIVTDMRALDLLRATLKEYPGMQVITGPTENVKTLAAQFTLPVGSPLDALDRIYVLDPKGNLMMSYPADADPSGMRKDLARLLKVSRIG